MGQALREIQEAYDDKMDVMRAEMETHYGLKVCHPVHLYHCLFRFSSFLVHSSFIPAISISPLQVLYYSEALPTRPYSTDTVSEFHAEAHRQLQVKDLPKVPTWRLEREWNPRPSG